jgi:transposase
VGISRAIQVATLLRLNSLPTSYAPTPELRQLRALVKDRLFYRRSWQSVANHVYHRLIRSGIQYEDGVLHKVRKREELRKLDLPDVNRGIDTLQDLEGRTNELNRAIHVAWSASPEAQLLTTIPGIGEITAVALAAYLCPIERFGSSEEVSSYVGLVPSSYQSAERAYHGRIRRDSNGLLRWMLIEAGWAHRRFEPHGDVAKFARRISRRRGKGKGMVAGARKLVRIVYAILKEKRPYSLHAPGLPAPAKVVRRPRTAA